MNNILKFLLCIGTVFSAHAGLEDLLITEIVVAPTESEFVEIHNKGGDLIDLSDVYLTDATYANGGTYYYQLVEGAGGGGDFSDFFARFPHNATIAAGEYQTIALNGSDDFFTAYSEEPTYELYEDAVSADGILDMREARIGSINGQGRLSDDDGDANSGEVLVLFYWDEVATTDLVQDLDYVVWGDKIEAVSKTNVLIDGPDPDEIDSAYLDDTDISLQKVISINTHAQGNSWQRTDMTEGGEVQSGGNGINGSDETSENIDFTFSEGMPTPNAATNITPPIAQFVINEIDTISTGNDFIELYGNGNTSTDGYTLVLYDGDTDLSTAVVDLNGMTTNINGYLLINNELQDGADAVALYAADSSNFMTGAALVYTDIMDAVVYGSGAPDTELLSLLNPNQTQVDEAANGNAAGESLIRCSNGSGGQLNSGAFKAFTPSPGAENSNCVTFDDYYNSADTTNAATLRLSLHQIIDDHISYPYFSDSPDTWDILRFADEDPNPAVDLDPQISEQVWAVYKNEAYATEEGGNSNYNREHTWPQTYGFHENALGTHNTARTDTHHLMISNITYNSSRDSLYFDNCPSGCTELPSVDYNGQGGGTGTYPGNSNWYNGSVFEVWNARKGDIARAMFYMDVRYEASSPGDPTPSGEVDLILTDDSNLIDNNQPYMGLLSVLLEWHELDPVDEIELYRNDEVFAYQLNRNPFIDHPEWVECIFVDGGACETVDNDIIFTHGFEQ